MALKILMCLKWFITYRDIDKERGGRREGRHKSRVEREKETGGRREKREREITSFTLYLCYKSCYHLYHWLIV